METGVGLRHLIQDKNLRVVGMWTYMQKDNGETTEMVWARHEDGRRSRSEESDDESDTGERKRGRPNTRWKDVCKMDMQTVGLREGDEGDRAYWKESINNHSGDPR